ncbi:LysR family transcriptional regulator [Neptunicella sp.]|uniref:LysR family transcriptional regulator n=1 Tax=Neptunicella sp. TaxID=2125986 RepID=UPI003F68DC48
MKSKFSLDDMHLFQLVVQYKGINATAAVTGIAPATLSRRLKALEIALGGRLLERSAHHFSLTEMGKSYYSQCSPLLTDLYSIVETLETHQHKLCGRLKITAPISLSQRWLSGCFFDFAKRYPQIHLELVLSNHYENLVEQQFDAAFRVGEPHEPNWIARHVLTTHMGLCASKSYLQQVGDIRHPQDLADKKLIVAEPVSVWDLQHQHSGEVVGLNPQSRFRTNDFHLAIDAIAADLGVGLVPNYYFRAGQKDSRSLQAVLPEWMGQQRPVYLLYRDRQTVSARLRVFIDFVIEWTQAYQIV